MKLSVVIPAFNEEKYIHIPLDSLCKQKNKNFQVIVCLNNCTDGTENIVRSYQIDGKLDVQIINENRKGVAFARDTGFKFSSGDIIASADADTFYPADWTEKINQTFSNNKIDCIYGPVYIKSNSALMRFAARYLFTTFLGISNYFGNYNLNGMNFAIRREVFYKIGGFNTNWKSAEDVYIGIKLKQMHHQIKFMKDLVVYTHDRRFEKEKFASLWHHIKNYINVFIKKGEPEKFKDIR